MNLKTIISTLILVCYTQAIWSQSAQTPTQEGAMENIGSYSTLLDSAQYYLTIDADQSINFVEGALRRINQSKTRKSADVSTAYILLGDIYVYWKAYDLAHSNYEKALENTSSKKRNPVRLVIQLKLAKSYLLNKDYNKSKSLALELQNDKRLSKTQKLDLWEILGDSWMGLQSRKKALKAYNKALNLAKDTSNKNKTITLNSKIAELYSQKGDFNNAVLNYQNSIQIAQGENIEQQVVQNEKLADLYRGNNEFDKEITLRKNSLKHIKKIPTKITDTLTSQSINLDIGDAYVGQKRFNEAIPYFNKSIQDAADSKDLKTEKDAVQRLSAVYKEVGDFDNALLNYQKYVTLVDLLYAKKEKEILAANSFSNTLALKQNRIEILEKDRELSESQLKSFEKEQELTQQRNQKQQLLIYLMGGGLLLLFLVLYLMYRSNQQKKLANNVLALKSLRSQMNPHFIFNALNSVNSFIAQNDERTANKYLTDFSTLMRTVLEHSEKDFIPLSKEIELIQLYLKLEHARFQDKFEYHFEIAKNIDTEQFQIPPMLIQPYIENAVWHGLRYKKEKGNLTVAIQQESTDTLIISITDDGIGRTQSKSIKTSNQLKQKSKGMGNIASRIAILNEMYAEKISVQINDLHKDGSGTVVRLLIS